MTISVFAGLPTVQTGTRGRPAVDWSAVCAELVESGKALTVEMSGEATAASTMSRLRRSFADLKVRGVKSVNVTREGTTLTIAVEPTTHRAKKTSAEQKPAKARKSRSKAIVETAA